MLLAEGAQVTSIDLSEAVDANLENFPDAKRHRVAQADIRTLPFRPGEFDIVICLGVVQHTPDGQPPIKQVRLRDFEATMSGAFYLVEQYDELAEFFEPDKEIVFFRDAAELIEKTRFYLRHDAARTKIRDAGLRRARAEHTWHRRFEDSFQQMGLPASRPLRSAS